MKIVLTGGPSAGKTTIAEALTRAYWDRVALVPESASILYGGGFPREDFPEAIVCQQRAIYRVQLEVENIVELKNPGHALICDRGTLDGLAFWPIGEDTFFKNMQTTKEAELNRYDWIIHLETASEKAYKPSLIRRESYAEAHLIDRRLQMTWRSHPRWALIPNTLDFSVKIARTMLAISMITAAEPMEKIKALLAAKT